MSWTRSFAAAASAACGANPDTTSDVRLAVSELVMAIVASEDTGHPIELRCVLDDEMLVWDVSPWSLDPHATEASMAWDIVTALIDDVSIHGDAVQLRVPLAEDP